MLCTKSAEDLIIIFILATPTDLICAYIKGNVPQNQKLFVPYTLLAMEELMAKTDRYQTVFDTRFVQG